MGEIGYFFDCHNTLIKSNEAWIKSFAEYVPRNYVEDIELKLYGKKKRRDIAKEYALDFQFVEKGADKYMEQNALIIDFVKLLKAQGKHLFIVSNAPRYRVEMDLDNVGIRDFFDEIYTAEEGGKQNQDIFNTILSKYSLELGLFIGNEEFDDHIDHQRIISVALTSFLRKRFNIVQGYRLDENGVIYGGEL